ncbi:MAG: hypothetical protein ACFE8J_19055 [Candidatus Heimdallarchaeota archaeon]
MLIEPIEVFNGHIEKAELMIYLLKLVEKFQTTVEEISSDFDKNLEEMAMEDPFGSTIGYLFKCTLEYKTQDQQKKFFLFKKTVREYTIVPAITATETYYKLIYELQKGAEYKGTIGSLESINKNISEIDPFDILSDEEINKI